MSRIDAERPVEALSNPNRRTSVLEDLLRTPSKKTKNLEFDAVSGFSNRFKPFSNLKKQLGRDVNAARSCLDFQTAQKGQKRFPGKSYSDYLETTAKKATEVLNMPKFQAVSNSSGQKQPKFDFFEKTNKKFFKNEESEKSIIIDSVTQQVQRKRFFAAESNSTPNKKSNFFEKVEIAENRNQQEIDKELANSAGMKNMMKPKINLTQDSRSQRTQRPRKKKKRLQLREPEENDGMRTVVVHDELDSDYKRSQIKPPSRESSKPTQNHQNSKNGQNGLKTQKNTKLGSKRALLHNNTTQQDWDGPMSHTRNGGESQAASAASLSNHSTYATNLAAIDCNFGEILKELAGKEITSEVVFERWADYFGEAAPTKASKKAINQVLAFGFLHKFITDFEREKEVGYLEWNRKGGAHPHEVLIDHKKVSASGRRVGSSYGSLRVLNEHFDDQLDKLFRLLVRLPEETISALSLALDVFNSEILKQKRKTVIARIYNLRGRSKVSDVDSNKIGRLMKVRCRVVSVEAPKLFMKSYVSFLIFVVFWSQKGCLFCFCTCREVSYT